MKSVSNLNLSIVDLADNFLGLDAVNGDPAEAPDDAENGLHLAREGLGQGLALGLHDFGNLYYLIKGQVPFVSSVGLHVLRLPFSFVQLGAELFKNE